MRDQRLDKLARVLVTYSTQIKPGQLVRLSGDPVAMPLLEALYEATLRAGAHPYLRCTPDSLEFLRLELGSDEQLEYISPVAKHEVETIDTSISLWAETNTRSLSRADPRKQSLASAARKPIFKTFMARAAKKELRWCGTLFPTAASAQDAEMSLRQYEDFVFDAGHLDKPDPVAEWQRIEACQQRVVDYLQGTKELRFQTPVGTDLTVNVEGMTWVNCCGHENFPDGEVFTGPNLDAPDGGVNGVVHYSFPAVHHGREVEDIVLTFEKGRVVDAKASKNQVYLIQMLDQDEGARSLGVHVESVRRWVFVASSLMVGAVVSVTGLIGFVGLVVPHAVRLVVGPDHRVLLPATLLVGATLLPLADLTTRLLFPVLGATQIPVGVVTAFIGGPTFVWLLRRGRWARRAEEEVG